MLNWINTAFPPITSRVNDVAPGANLSPQDIYYLMMFCPFETVAHGYNRKKHDRKLTNSAWCDIFGEEEWKVFEYVGDLDKYYGTG
jgi:hypothetical protein